jgi:hypothetical protein
MNAYRTPAPREEVAEVERPFFPRIGDAIVIGPRVTIWSNTKYLGCRGRVVDIFRNGIYLVILSTPNSERSSVWAALFSITEIKAP